MLPLVEGPRVALSVLPFGDWPFAAVLFSVAHGVDRRDLARYEVEETERGRDGR
jgi:hypothetical protein